MELQSILRMHELKYTQNRAQNSVGFAVRTWYNYIKFEWKRHFVCQIFVVVFSKRVPLPSPSPPPHSPPPNIYTQTHTHIPTHTRIHTQPHHSPLFFRVKRYSVYDNVWMGGRCAVRDSFFRSTTDAFKPSLDVLYYLYCIIWHLYWYFQICLSLYQYKHLHDAYFSC